MIMSEYKTEKVMEKKKKKSRKKVNLNYKIRKTQTCAKAVHLGKRAKKLSDFWITCQSFVQNPQNPGDFLRFPANFFMIFMNCFPENVLL